MQTNFFFHTNCISKDYLPPKNKLYIKRHSKIPNSEVFEVALHLARFEACHIPIFPDYRAWQGLSVPWAGIQDLAVAEDEEMINW